MRLPLLCPRGSPGGYALAYLGNPLFSLSLLSQCPASTDDAPSGMTHKPLLATERDQCLGPLLHGLGLAQGAMEYGIPGPDKSRGQRVSNLLHESQGCAIPHPRLV